MATKSNSIYDRAIAELEKEIIQKFGEVEGRKWIEKIKKDADDFVERNLKPSAQCKVQILN